MSESKAKSEPRSAGEQSSEQAFYLYCIGERETLAPLLAEETPPVIEHGFALELIAGEALAAVVSAVPLADYGEEALAEHLTDPAWTATRAMRHEAVVEHFARRAAVIPLRFGAIYLQRERVAGMLGERAAEFRSIIERLRGRDEWGVNLYCDRARLLEAIPQASPRLREMNERAAQASPGQAYLLRKQIEAARADEARAAIKRAATRIEQNLVPHSAASTRLRIPKGDATEQGEAIARFAFLVGRAGFPEFRAALEREAQEAAPLGMTLEVTGPWPAYNFAAGESNR